MRKRHHKEMGGGQIGTTQKLMILDDCIPVPWYTRSTTIPTKQQPNQPVYLVMLLDLLNVVDWLIRTLFSGIFHDSGIPNYYSNEMTTLLDTMDEIFQLRRNSRIILLTEG